MKIRLANYIADFLVAHGIDTCFTVVGGGAMHLNDAFGHHPALQSIYNHHEQACAIAAEAYARYQGKPALVCVTTGPGGTNAITGVVGAWLDSVPMFVVSGQVRYDTTARYAQRFLDEGLSLRAVGDQEYDIIRSVSPMTKFAAMLENPKDIRYILEKAWYKMEAGRPGPVWLDIPVDYQGMTIETDELRGFDPSRESEAVPPEVDAETIGKVMGMIKSARRPVIYAGGGVRASHAFESFRRTVDILGIPVVTYWNSIDLMEDEHPLYCGRGGNMGDRAGNFAVQNADLVIAIGTRLSIRQVGYNWASWARAAKVIMIDVDRAELQKHTLHIDMPVWADAKDFLEKLLGHLNTYSSKVFLNTEWVSQCQTWKRRYPVVTEKQRRQEGLVNIYAFIRYLSEQLPEGSITAASNGACCVAGHQSWNIKEGTRFLINNAIASMGYGLPAAVGLCVSAGRRETVCLEGDGSVMMNLQELQTIVTNRLPVKLFLINNSGYHSIRLTQSNLFAEHSRVGIGPESHDLSFPSFQKIAEAFGYPYFPIRSNCEIPEAVSGMLTTPGYAFCEVFTDVQQAWEPKSGAKCLSDGTMVSSPLEDLAPFLSREELRENMYIPLES